MDPKDSNPTACAKCGHKGYAKQHTAAEGRHVFEWRCFPHLRDRRLSPSQRRKIDADYSYALGHIDVGLPENMDNGRREQAWGKTLLDPIPSRRAGLDR